MLRRPVLAALACLLASAGTAAAQGHGGAAHGAGGPQGTGGAQPYAGLEARPVKALSERQVADLRAGRGMGLALPAELNGYPGPMHVLEHADALGLSPAQRDATEALLATMRAEAVPLGERLIRDEAELERLFAGRIADAASVERATASVGATQAALRAAHLRAHLAQLALLTPEQARRYGELRGYGRGGDAAR